MYYNTEASAFDLTTEQFCMYVQEQYKTQVQRLFYDFSFQTLVGLVKAITSGSVHPIDFKTYDRSMQDLVDSMLSILPDKRPAIKDLMGRMVILPDIYTVYLDAGNEELLYLRAKDFLY